jgi:hypothetical protein
MRSLTPTDLQSVLGLLVSVVTTFLTVSYVASNATEALGSLLHWRSNLLLRAVKNLLKDPTFNGLARDIYNNPKVNPGLPRTVTREAELKAKPRYIDPLVFAEALLEAGKLIDPDTGQLTPNPQEAIRLNIPNDELQNLAASLLKRSNYNLDVMRGHIADWYSRATNEMVVTYQHRTQLMSFIIGFALAALLDLEPIPIGNLPSAGAAATPAAPVNMVEVMTSVFQWLVVGLSTLFGAQFWYSVLLWATGKTGNGGGKGTDQSTGPGASPGGGSAPAPAGGGVPPAAPPAPATGPTPPVEPVAPAGVVTTPATPPAPATGGAPPAPVGGGGPPPPAAPPPPASGAPQTASGAGAS